LRICCGKFTALSAARACALILERCFQLRETAGWLSIAPRSYSNSSRCPFYQQSASPTARVGPGRWVRMASVANVGRRLYHSGRSRRGCQLQIIEKKSVRALGGVIRTRRDRLPRPAGKFVLRANQARFVGHNAGQFKLRNNPSPPNNFRPSPCGSDGEADVIAVVKPDADHGMAAMFGETPGDENTDPPAQRGRGLKVRS